MNFDRLRELILERAIQGKLVPQLESEPLASQIACKSENLPFKIPEKWGSAYLADLIEFLDYGTSTKCHATKEVQDVPVLRMCNIDNGIVNLENLKYANRDLIELPRPYLQYGDLVFNRTNSLELVGKCAPFLRDEKCSFASYLIRVRPKPMINTKYLSYWINSNICRRTQIHPKVSKQVGQANFSGSKLKQIVVPLPPIEEQLRIVFKIDDLFAKIKLLENSYRELQKLKEALRKLILQKAVQGKIVPQLESEPGVEQIGEAPENVPFAIPEKWKWCQIKNLTTICSARRVHKSDWQMEGVPFFRAREIAKLAEQGFVNNELFISEELYAQLTKGGLVEEGDLMITAVGTLGKVYIVKRGDRFYYKDASVICMKRCQHIDPHFAKIIFTSPFMKNQIIDASSGTTVGTITIKGAMDYWVPIPPIEEQHRIVAKLNELLGIVVQLENTISAP